MKTKIVISKTNRYQSTLNVHGGFTLAELMVSLAIASILMLGLSAFFSDTFRVMFVQSEKLTGVQRHFLITTVLADKFLNTTGLDTSGNCNSDCAVLKNPMEKGESPFTFIGLDGGGPLRKIVSKDFFVFNGRHGTLGSQNAVIKNAAGITQFGSDYFVAAPLENQVYQCDAGLTSCNPLNVQGLDQPMDLAVDSTNNLYVTDAGKGRILKIAHPGQTNQAVSELITGLNYPTGLTFYSYGGSDYLFVSDTYNHLVKKIALASGSSVVIAGNGSDEVCDPSDGLEHSALYCKLNYPTGLVVGGGSLYIADTGHGRILKIADPGYPAEFNLDFSSLDADEAIKEIRLTFPSGTDATVANVVSVSSNNDSLRETGAVVTTANQLFYRLWTTLIDDTVSTNACDPQPCSNTMNKIEVDNDDLFNSTTFKNLYMAGEPLTVQSKNGSILNLTGNFSVDQPFGEVVTLTAPIPPETLIHFELSNVDTSAAASGFQKIKIGLYDETDTPLETRYHSLRIGNGELGTPEDTISVDSLGYDFPTGLGWSGILNVSATPSYSTVFQDFDFVSSFDVQNASFSRLNSSQLLEFSFDGVIGEDADGIDLFEHHVLNAYLNP